MSSKPAVWSECSWVYRIPSSFLVLQFNICCLKSGPQSITKKNLPHFNAIDTLNLLSFGFKLLQTGWLLPIIGTPWEVPVPKKIISITNSKVNFVYKFHNLCRFEKKL